MAPARTRPRLLVVIAVAAIITLILALVYLLGRLDPPGPAPGADAGAIAVVPAPVTVIDTEDAAFRLTAESRIVGPAGIHEVGTYLAELLRPATGYELPVLTQEPIAGDLVLDLGPDRGPDGAVRPGGYVLDSGPAGLRIAAADAEGLFAGIQTLRQLLPPQVESQEVVGGDWRVPALHIEDWPRFAYRGAMLDVARHFFSVEDVQRYLDDLARLKINHLHLHLTDDQGWRLAVDGWPELTGVGASTEAGGGQGGFYTSADYGAIVDYAAARFITVVPEIDLPGHTNAALSAYPELACDGKAPAPYTGIDVGLSSLCIDSEATYDFVADVIAQVAALTPGPYLHVGGDEADATSDAEFAAFMARVLPMVEAEGKTVIGWHDIGKSPDLPAGTVGQYWGYAQPDADAQQRATSVLDQGGLLLMSPADVAYLDMKYDDGSRLGLTWANGPTNLAEAAGWDPAQILPGVGDEQILGVEAPLWAETLRSIEDVEQMAFPRLAAIAEIAWSPAGDGGFGRDLGDLAPRLAALGRHLDMAGIAFERVPEVDWDARS